jgi:hypothetical protein
LKRTPQSEHPLPRLDGTEAGVARRENGPFRPAQVQSRHFLRSENPIVFVQSGSSAIVGTREYQST